MATQTGSHCVLCQNPLRDSHPAAIRRSTQCSVFINKCDSMITELWAWIATSTNSPLEGMCGLIIDDVPHRAISDTFEGALKLTPFLKSAAQNSGDKFQLVRFVKEKAVAQI